MLSELETRLLGVMMMLIMLGMGASLTFKDFRIAFRKPKGILIGMVCQYGIMPFLAYALAVLLGLSPALAIGLILMGCMPGGTTSNIFTYFSKGTLALSIMMTICSTLVAVAVVPLLLQFYSGLKDLPAEFTVPAGNVAQVLVVLVVPTLIGIALRKWNPNVGRPIAGFTWRDRFASLPGTLPVILVVIIIFASMLFGWATPTEAGALGAFVVFIAALLNRMKLKQLNDALLETAKLTVMIFAIIWGILIFVRFLGFAGVPEHFSEWVLSLPVPPWAIMLGILFVYLVLGCFMDGIGMLLLTLPVFYPAVIKLGYDPIWFGIIVVKMTGVCLLTPPIGLSCFVVAAVRRDIPLADVFRGTLPFVLADFLAIGIFMVWPELITWLPDQMIR